jgi:hypothetical protein
MSVREFRDDDDGYRTWIAIHPSGYVINILRSHNIAGARMHHADCYTIGGQNRGSALTKQYVKECAEQLSELEQWASDRVGQPIPPCEICRPGPDAVQPIPRKRITPAVGGLVPEGRYEIHPPAASSTIVEAWADDYIRFERRHRPPWQERLRDEIRARCRKLKPSDQQVLHATFFGEKLPNADVENLVLYYIDDSLRVAGRNGIRFEHGAAVPSAPDDGEYPFCYRYKLAPPSGGFIHWRQERTLASFDWINLGDKKLAHVWLSLKRHQGQPLGPPRASATPFAVRVQIRAPHGPQPPVSSELLKGIIDGVVCAFQAQIGTADLDEVSARLARMLPADPAEIKELLLDQRSAVLGVVPRLVYRFRKGVKWEPADHMCVAGELLAAKPEPRDQCWAIKGEIVELSGV